MAKFELKFFDTAYEDDFITVKKINTAYSGDTIYIKVVSDNDGTISDILLDKSTAIKFAKTLRTEINKIKEDSNG